MNLRLSSVIVSGTVWLAGGSATSWGQCTKDTDCKGNRICVDGDCQDSGAKELRAVCSFVQPIDEAISLGFATSEGRKVVEEIGEAVGLENMPRIVTGSVPNASAVIYGSERLIVYSDSFIESMREKAGRWSVSFVFAHELGHHVEGHTISGQGSNHKDEFQADAFATRALKRMGATLDQTMSAMKAMPMPPTQSHPGSEKRVAHIKEIFQGADGTPALTRKKGTKPDVVVDEPKPAPPPQPMKLPSGTQTRPCGCHGFVTFGTTQPNAYCASGIEWAVPCQGLCLGGGSPWATVCR